LAAPQQSANKFGFLFGLHNRWINGTTHEQIGGEDQEE